MWVEKEQPCLPCEAHASLVSDFLSPTALSDDGCTELRAPACHLGVLGVCLWDGDLLDEVRRAQPAEGSALGL